MTRSSTTPSTLVLVPTQFELGRLGLESLAQSGGYRAELCGFGPVAAACQTMRWLCSAPYDRVVLCGIAGSYGDELAIGDVVTFSSVQLDGVGVMDEGRLRSGAELGFETSIPERIDGLEPMPAARHCDGLLTVCACSETIMQADRRSSEHGGAWAEDMEGYGVAMACFLHRVPLIILRGISNRAGDRDKRHWDIDRALRSVRRVLAQSSS